MKRRMFSKISTLIHNAVEALATDQPSQEKFSVHWRGLTQFFLEATDDRVAITSTSIPYNLEQMLEILLEELHEHKDGTTGPCTEYLLQHKILETLQTLARADCPPGMKQHVLLFFTNLLGKTNQPLLHHVHVHKPVHRLIRCCGEVKAGPTETEEAQFLLQVCSKLKQDPHLVNFFLEAPSKETNELSPRDPSSLTSSSQEGAKPEYCLVDSLLELTRSEDSRVAIKACEGLMLCVSIKEDYAATVVVLYTAFCEKMADQLCRLFKSCPMNIDPSDIAFVSAKWGLDIYSADDDLVSFHGKRQLISFLSWLDYVNQLSSEAHPMIAKALGQSINDRFLRVAVEPSLLQASETGMITVTAILTRCLKVLSAPCLVQEFSSFLLGNDTDPETQKGGNAPKLRNTLIHRIDHLSDQMSIEVLKLFDALLRLPTNHVTENLVLRNISDRGYAAEAVETHVNGDCESDNRHPLGAEDESSMVSSEIDQMKVEKIVNGFLSLIPPILKTTDTGTESSFDSYLRDAHKQCTARITQSANYGWPSTTKPSGDLKRAGPFYEGLFLQTIFNRLRRLLDQPYDVSLFVTSIVSLLSQFPHPLLQELLISPLLITKDQCQTPHKILEKLAKDIETRMKRISNSKQRLNSVRKRLQEPNAKKESTPDETFYEGAIILEEFCKELAAIAFVSITSQSHSE